MSDLPLAVIVGETGTWSPSAPSTRRLARLLVGPDGTLVDLRRPQLRLTNLTARRWDPIAAARRARFFTSLYSGDGVLFVLLGRRVARAFRVSQPFCQRADHEGVEVVVLPHPSGLNRWWQTPANRRLAEAAYRWVWWRVTR